MNHLTEYGHRRLSLSASGLWYIVLTIGLGVVAIGSKNNILYLLESFLLGGLILSGVLSELAVASVSLHCKQRPLIAGRIGDDELVVTNNGRLPVFCLEVGEWIGKKLHPRAFVTYLAPRSTISLRTEFKPEHRGWHRWEGLGCSTRYPFGFTAKIRFVRGFGERLVWPSMGKTGSYNQKLFTASRQASDEFADGEIRQAGPDDDFRLVVWTLSAFRGEPLMRVRRPPSRGIEVVLDTRCEPGETFEAAVRQAAQAFYEAGTTNSESMLITLGYQGKKIFRNRQTALDALALIEAQGTSP